MRDSSHPQTEDLLAPSSPLPSGLLMEAALEQLHEGVILTDHTGRITFVNQAAARLHGMSRLDVEPEDYAESYHLLTENGDPYPSSELPLARAALRGETVVDARWRVRRSDGTEVLAVGTARPIFAPHGEQVGAILTIRDETSRADAVAARTEAEAERARSADILESMEDAYFVLDKDYRFVSVNASTERILAQHRDQLIGRLIWDLFPTTLGTIFETSYRRVVNERVEVHFREEYADAVLDIVPEVDAYPTVDGGIAVFWRDIAPRLRAEEELRASEQRLRDVFEQAPVAVAVMTGPEHIYTVVSPMYAKTPGLGRQLLGRSMREAFPEIADLGYFDALDEVYRTGVPFSATERPVGLMRVDGVREERFFNVGYQPLRDRTGAVYAVASVAYDVTDQVRARHEVDAARVEAERQRALAEQANAAKGEFLSTMSHELRTPLNAIAGYAQLLTLELRGPITDHQRQDLERIRFASEHLMGLVTDVLNFARLDAGKIDYQIDDVEFATVLDELEPLVGPQLRARNLSFDHDGCAPDTPDQPHMVRTDPEKLRQILLNLLTNAIKFTEAGGRVTMTCQTDKAAGVVRVRVSDTGRGIPQDQLERIFEPFVQVDRHRTLGSQQGVGLGLSISRDLARGLGGDLVAESVVGAGSTFTLTLPLA